MKVRGTAQLSLSFSQPRRSQMDEAEEEYCQALYSFEPADHNELALEVGEVIKILSKDDFTWWKGESLDGRRGYFPVDYVQPISSVEVWNDGTSSQYKESKPNHVGTNGKSRAEENEGVQMEPIPEEFEKPEAPPPRTPQSHTKPKPNSDTEAPPEDFMLFPPERSHKKPAPPSVDTGRWFDSWGRRLTEVTRSFWGDEEDQEQDNLIISPATPTTKKEPTADSSPTTSSENPSPQVKDKSVERSAKAGGGGRPSPPRRPTSEIFDDVSIFERRKRAFMKEMEPVIEQKREEVAKVLQSYFQELKKTAEATEIFDAEWRRQLVLQEGERVLGLASSLFQIKGLDQSVETQVSTQNEVIQTEKKVVVCQAVVRGWLVRKRYRGRLRRIRQRRKCLSEIVKSERTYVTSLEVLVEHLKRPLDQSVTISRQDTLSLFSNVELILGVNRVLLKGLEERIAHAGSPTFSDNPLADPQKAGCIGDIFLRLAPFLKLYTQYVNNFDLSNETYDRLYKNSEEFLVLLESFKKNPQVGMLQFTDFQILPIQRVPRYTMLIQELIKYSDESHPDYPDLVKAEEMLREVAVRINEAKRDTENLNKIIDIQNKMVGTSEELVQPFRRFVYEGPVVRAQVRASQSIEGEADGGGGSAAMAGAATLVYMFLFNDMLMLTDKRKSFSGEEQYFFKEQIDLTGMFVAEMGSSQKGFVLKTKYGIVEQFFAENVEKRVLWVKHLENATTELGKKRATIMPVSTSSSGGIPVYVEDTSSTSNADKEPTKEISQEKEEADKTTAAKDKEVKPTKEPPPPPKLEAPRSTTPRSLALEVTEMLELFEEALELQKELYQKPLELQTIVPEYCQRLQPDHLRKLASRLIHLKKKLNEIKSLSNKVGKLMKDERKVHRLHTSIAQGKECIGNMRAWIQQSAQPQQGGRCIPLHPEKAKEHMTPILKWYIELCTLWPAIIEE